MVHTVLCNLTSKAPQCICVLCPAVCSTVFVSRHHVRQRKTNTMSKLASGVACRRLQQSHKVRLFGVSAACVIIYSQVSVLSTLQVRPCCPLRTAGGCERIGNSSEAAIAIKGTEVRVPAFSTQAELILQGHRNNNTLQPPEHALTAAQCVSTSPVGERALWTARPPRTERCPGCTRKSCACTLQTCSASAAAGA